MSENSVPSRTINLITTGVITLCVVAIALAAVFLVGLNLNDDDPAPAASRTSPGETYGIVTSGEGKVSAKPDQLTFSATVTNRRSTTADAMAATNRGIRAVTTAAKDVGIAASDIETTTVSIRPSYRYDNSGEHLNGYVSTQKIKVLVRTLADAGKVIGAVTTAGGNAVSIGGISLSISNSDELVAKARTEAVTKSKAAAEALARAAGRDVGQLEFVEEVVPQVDQYKDYGAYDSAALNGLAPSASASVPISPGKQDVSVTVKVRWSIAGQ